jgi:hypothetical protein
MTLPVRRRDKEEVSRRALAQGPYDQWWKYALVTTPLFVALAIVRARRLVQRAQRYGHALIHAKEAFDWVTGTEITSTFTV